MLQVINKKIIALLTDRRCQFVGAIAGASMPASWIDLSAISHASQMAYLYGIHFVLTLGIAASYVIAAYLVLVGGLDCWEIGPKAAAQKSLKTFSWQISKLLAGASYLLVQLLTWLQSYYLHAKSWMTPTPIFQKTVSVIQSGLMNKNNVTPSLSSSTKAAPESVIPNSGALSEKSTGESHEKTANGSQENSLGWSIEEFVEWFNEGADPKTAVAHFGPQTYISFVAERTKLNPRAENKLVRFSDSYGSLPLKKTPNKSRSSSPKKIAEKMSSANQQESLASHPITNGGLS